jgi:site-specific recombinase XerD
MATISATSSVDYARMRGCLTMHGRPGRSSLFFSLLLSEPQNERGGPISTSTFHKIVARCGRSARLSFPAHPHQLRHACRWKMINRGKIDIRIVQVWMGHRNIQNTVRYTEVDPKLLKGLWKD